MCASHCVYVKNCKESQSLNAYNFSFARSIFNNFFNILKAHKKFYKMMCLVKKNLNSLILAILPTYSPCFFLKNS